MGEDQSAKDLEDTHILLVDDEELLIRIITNDLESQGAKVNISRSMPEALKIMGSRSFDIVISDFKMPGGSGIELIKAMKEKGFDKTPCVIMTGHTEQSRFMLEEQGADGVLYKPFSYQDLVDVVKSSIPKN